MTTILRRLPFYEAPSEAETPTGSVVIRSYQIIAWVSLSVRGRLTNRFPVVLDTGHSHNFSIREDHVLQWAGVAPDGLPRRGIVRVNRQPVELHAAEVAIWRNTPGQRDALSGAEPFILQLPEGIAVHKADAPYAPRLPLLGMRALVRNNLKLTIDADRKEVNLSRPRRWFG